MMKPVDIFHIGPQKAATTWTYRCLLEHPEVVCPPSDTIHYFDIFYSKGRQWYSNFFEEAISNQVLFDPTYTYIRSTFAPRRIYKENSNAKIMLCLRNPIDRAFSHYWHEKKKGKIQFEFEEVLENYDLFSSWIEPGFYAEHIERYLQYFSPEQILYLRFEDLKKDPQSFLKQIYDFIEIKNDFVPSVLNKYVNKAGIKRNKYTHLLRKIYGFSSRLIPIEKIENKTISRFFSGKSEYLKGIPDNVFDDLFEICGPEINRLENLLNINLDNWKKNYS